MKRIEKLTNAEISAFFASFFFGIVVFIPWAGKLLQSADGAYADVLSLWYWDTSLGRWMIGPDSFLRNGLTLPLYSTAISVLMLSLTAMLWVRMFGIRGTLLGMFTGVLAMLYPCTANSMLLFYFQHMYFGSTFLATLAVYAVWRSKSFLGSTVGAILLCCSLGCYQPGICVAATLSLFCLIRLSAQIEEVSKIGKELLRYLAMGIGGCVLYVPITKLIWKEYGMNPATYGGIDEIGRLNVRLILPRAIQSYQHAVRLYFSDSVFDNTAWKLHLIYACIFMATVALAVVYVARGEARFKPLFWEIGFVLLLILPICLAMIELIVPDRDINYVMSMQYVIPLVACLKAVDVFSLQSSASGEIKRVGIAIIVILAVLCNTFWMYDTAIGVAAEMHRNKAASFANRIVYRMEDAEGYEPGMNVLICGRESTENYPLIYPKLHSTVVHSFASPGYMWSSIPLEQRGWNELIQSVCGIAYQIPEESDIERIMASEEYLLMPLYPAKDSIRVIDGVMVVKLSDNP